jgi:hypothetical protein
VYLLRDSKYYIEEDYRKHHYNFISCTVDYKRTQMCEHLSFSGAVLRIRIHIESKFNWFLVDAFHICLQMCALKTMQSYVCIYCVCDSVVDPILFFGIRISFSSWVLDPDPTWPAKSSGSDPKYSFFHNANDFKAFLWHLKKASFSIKMLD